MFHAALTGICTKCPKNANCKDYTVARILLPSSNIGIRGGYHGCQLVEVYKTFVYLEKYLKA